MWSGSPDAPNVPLPPSRTDGFHLLRRSVWILDTARKRKVYANAAALKLWGVETTEDAEDFFARDFTPHSPAIRQRFDETIERIARGEVLRERWTFYPRGRPFTVDCVMSGVRLEDGSVGMLVEATLPEIAPEERRAVEALRHTPVMVTLYDEDGRVVFRNPAAAQCYPHEDHTFVAGFADPTEGADVWREALAHDPHRTDAFMGTPVSGSFRMMTSEGERWHGIDVRTTSDPVTGQVCLLVNERDVTDRVLARTRAEFLASHDAGTGLVNRGGFIERLEKAMAEPGSVGGLLMIDLDGFKEINDTHGHAAGDGVLSKVGARLRASSRPQDLCARLGGDEFAIILPGLSDPAVLHRRAEELKIRLVQTIEDPVSGGSINLSASFGAALWPEDGASPDALQRNADLALYSAKNDGGNRFQRFDMALRRAADERHQIIEDLRAGIERDEFDVYFQPLMSFKDFRPVGFEALVRWRHPVHGLLLPARFLTAAESVGLMTPIGNIVIEAACRQMKTWLDAGLAPGRIAINLSSNQFRNRDLATLVARMVMETGLVPSQVEFEVPETVTLGQNGESVVGILSDLRRLGFAIALDDFGTGYASLTHLRNLPVDTIKMDRSFINEMNRSLADRAIVRAVIGLGHDLGMKVLAEGIEIRAQLDAVAELGCDLGQGFLFGRPMPAGEATGWLLAHSPDAASRGRVVSFPAGR